MDEPRQVHSQDSTPPSGPTPGDRLESDPLPPDVLDTNVTGRKVSAPEDGFGQLWQKRFRIGLGGVELTPIQLIALWRERFGEFWPEGNHFYRPLTGLGPGEVALADLEMPGGSRLSTGIVVADVQPTSFTFLTPQGHTLAGTITFSAAQEAGMLVARVIILMRASDPLFEISLPLGGQAQENRFWQQTLRNLAAHLGVKAEPETTTTLVDPHRHWRNVTNVRHNAYLHTAAVMVTRPFRLAFERLTGRGGSS